MTAISLRSQMTALEFLQTDTQEKPLPSVPSPTLTNPDMLLPDEPSNVPAMPSPMHHVKRPPSPSYLRDKTNERPTSRESSTKREKRGLMSRKMMLLRSRTASGGVPVNGHAPAPRSAPSDSDVTSRPSTDFNSAYASSPTLQDVGNLAPERLEQKRLSTSSSSFTSDELTGIPSFLAKYEQVEGYGTGDELSDTDSPAQQKYGYTVSIAGGLDEKRRQQEEEEHNSAILSKRAEQILANAKKRLNLMEGNLRGARDLVAPLTAANLKRAASLGSSYHQPYAGRGRYGGDVYQHAPTMQQPMRTLHAQASSPTMGRDYQTHARVFSETELPERPYTALENSSPNYVRTGRIPANANNTSWMPTLRGSRSYDSLGSNGLQLAARERPLRSKGSPDSNLEPLPEDEASHQTAWAHSNKVELESHYGLGIERSPSTPDDLREQMSSLKGKISTLKERAREDSLRRLNQQSLRTPSPFNNALVAAPEFFYTQSQKYGSPVLDTNAGIGYTSNSNSPATPQNTQKAWDQNNTLTGSRNAFAEQAQRLQQQQEPQDGAEMAHVASSKPHRQMAPETRLQREMLHNRTPSGTAIVEPAPNRYSHHQLTSSKDIPGAYVNDEDEEPSSGEESQDAGVSSLPTDDPSTADEDREDHREEEESVYEDAEVVQPSVVAHEDRDDAFDYEHFFLHSAMGSYSNGRRNSTSSEETASSAETARGPTAVAGAEDACFANQYSHDLSPRTPNTPEQLKAIERNLHKRTFSDESISTLDTFATADEDPPLPSPEFVPSGAMGWPIPPPEHNTSGSHSRPNSRPGTAVKRPEPLRRRDSSSERADSGVGLPRRSTDAKRPGAGTPKTPTTAVASPPMSPRTIVLHDPATLAVNALINPEGQQLGLKDKALLFSLIESLKKTVHKLQEDDGRQYGSRTLRRRLDEARRVLEGSGDQQRPSSTGH